MDIPPNQSLVALPSVLVGFCRDPRPGICASSVEVHDATAEPLPIGSCNGEKLMAITCGRKIPTTCRLAVTAEIFGNEPL